MEPIEKLKKEAKELQKKQEDLLRKIEELEATEFKVNDWVEYKTIGNLFQIEKISPKTGGLMFKECKKEGYFDKDYYKLASHEKIKTHLIKQAKKRGLEIGKKIRSNCGSEGTIQNFMLVTEYDAPKQSSKCDEYFKENGIHLAVRWGNVYTYPVDLIKPVNELTFGGEEVKINGSHIKCCGESSTIENVQKLLYLIKELESWRFGNDCAEVRYTNTKEDTIQIGELTGKISEIDNIVNNNIKYLKF
jgi:hypothetical protein